MENSFLIQQSYAESKQQALRDNYGIKRQENAKVVARQKSDNSDQLWQDEEIRTYVAVNLCVKCLWSDQAKEPSSEKLLL